MKKTCLALLSLALLTATVPAADIVALVIGNNAYIRVEDQLDTPINDAMLMKRSLEALPGGADVKLLTDATKEQIEIALNALKGRAQGAKLALVFYSGHGTEDQPDGFPQNETFLLPVDATIPDVNYLPTRAVSLSTVLAALKAAPVTARAVILDCCRNGAPKATAALTGSTKSFGTLDERVKKALGNAVVPDATLIAFAASPGRKAAAFLTDADENSPFTKFLTDQLATGTGNLRDLVEAAAEVTETRTGQRQVPYVTYVGAASAIRQIVFRSSPGKVPASPALPSPVPVSVVDDFAAFTGKVPGERRLVEVAPGVSIPFRWCPPGTFTMGSSDRARMVMKAAGTSEDFFSDEVEHSVTLTEGFWLAETEVTQGQWQAVMGTTLGKQADKALADDTPYIFGFKEQSLRQSLGMQKGEGSKIIGVESEKVAMYFVNWEEADEFCTQAGRRAGKRGWAMTLPTEAQWEYACGAGSQAMTYDGDFEIIGDFNAPRLDILAWYGGNSSLDYHGAGWSTAEFKEKQYPGDTAGPRRVGGRRANEWGLSDMLGNVWEWCADYHDDYALEPAINPSRDRPSDDPSDRLDRVRRGGAWDSIVLHCRSAYRQGNDPSRRSNNVGFRPAFVPAR